MTEDNSKYTDDSAVNMEMAVENAQLDLANGTRNGGVQWTG